MYLASWAVYWLREAVRMGSAEAHTRLGFRYEKGIGVEINLKEAVKWYSLAAQLGDKNGMSELGRCYRYGIGTEVNILEAVRLYELAENEKSLKRLRDWFSFPKNQNLEYMRLTIEALERLTKNE